MRVAVLDLGSNAFHLLVADARPPRELVPVLDSKQVLRLGPDLLRAGRLVDAGWERAANAIGALLAAAEEVRAERHVAVVTGLLRDADDATGFISHVREVFHLEAAVLPPEEEARMAYLGAVSSLRAPDGRVRAVLSLGTSTVQLAVGVDTRVTFAGAAPIGLLRLPPGKAIPRLVRAAADGVVRRIVGERPDEVVLASTTARALARLAPAALSLETMRRLPPAVAALTPDDLRARGVGEEQVDTLAVAAQIAATLVEMIGVNRISVAERGVREGVVLRELARREPTRQMAIG